MTVISTLNSPNFALDEISTPLMMFTVFLMAGFTTVYFQINYKKLRDIMDFANENFRKRSAIGELPKRYHFHKV